MWRIAFRRASPGHGGRHDRGPRGDSPTGTAIRQGDRDKRPATAGETVQCPHAPSSPRSRIIMARNRRLARAQSPPGRAPDRQHRAGGSRRAAGTKRFRKDLRAGRGLVGPAPIDSFVASGSVCGRDPGSFAMILRTPGQLDNNIPIIGPKKGGGVEDRSCHQGFVLDRRRALESGGRLRDRTPGRQCRRGPCDAGKKQAGPWVRQSRSRPASRLACAATFREMGERLARGMQSPRQAA